jgi:hypothetical protein
VSAKAKTTELRPDEAPWYWYVFSWMPLLASVALAGSGHGAHAIQILYTPVASLLALYLCFRFPQVFVSYVVIMSCFSPLVRRMVDYHIGFTEKSPILLAPLLVPAVVGFRLIFHNILRARYFSFIFPLVAILYGTIIGAVLVGQKSVVTSAIGWTIPILFGLYCAIFEDDRYSLAHSFARTLVIGGVVASIYGIVQFVVPPVWDIYWLKQLQQSGSGSSIGQAIPFGIRTFSTLNGPSVAAAFLGCGLLVASQFESSWRYLAMALIGATLGLTVVRAEWIAFFLGACFLLIKAGPSARLKVILAICIAIPMLLAASNTPAGERINKRFATFGSLSKDSSYKVRSAGVTDATVYIAQRPFGVGMGFLDSSYFGRLPFAMLGGIGPHDIGILEFPFELGYLGTCLYGFSLATIFFSALRKGLMQTGEALALSVVAAHLLLLFADENPMRGAIGLLFWGPAGFLFHHFVPEEEAPAPIRLMSRPVLQSTR